MKVWKSVFLLLFIVSLTSCRIIQEPSVGGDILSSSGTMDCLLGPCVVPVTGDFSQTFTARPHAGYDFVSWTRICSNEPTGVCVLELPSVLTEIEVDVPLIAMFAPTPTDNLATERVVMGTNFGYLVIELFGDLAPLTVQNFLQYVDAEFYDDTIFHRVFRGSINGIQGGGFGWNKKAGVYPTQGIYAVQAGAPIQNESFNRLSNTLGAIAMARTSAPDSATSQFFFNFGDNSVLDYVSGSQDGYAVFGRVVTGIEVIEAIYNLERFTTFGAPFGELPVEPVIITGITRHAMPANSGG